MDSVQEKPMNVFTTRPINDTRTTLEKAMPIILALAIAFFAGKALKKMAWTAFGMYMALHYSGIHPFG
jgi:hypothetical protein